jgi:two-component system KDP operon response regulator KdpE
VGQLRKKIELAPEPRYILSEPWIGYRFVGAGDHDRGTRTEEDQ